MDQEIKKLPASTSKLITCTQIITSISTAVKELVENSLDAGARNIEIRLENYGFDQLEVRDDGFGIKCIDVPKMGLSGYTSKIESFENLDELESYGFRGEALSALCKLSNVSVTTKAPDDSIAMTYVLDSNGCVVSSKPSHILKGTVVNVTNLFGNVPVRKQFLSSGKKSTEELKKVEHIVKCLSIIHPALRISIKHNKCQIWQKNSVNDIRQSFMQLVGLKLLTKMIHLKEKRDDVQIELIIPKKDLDNLDHLFLTQSDVMYIFVNKRIIKDNEMRSVVMKHISEHYSDQDLKNKTSISLLTIELPLNEIDVNLEPNKTKILFRRKEYIVLILEQILIKYYCDNLDNYYLTTDSRVLENGSFEKQENSKNITNCNDGDEVPAPKKPKLIGNPSDVSEDCPRNICTQINVENNILSQDEVSDLNEMLKEKSKKIVVDISRRCNVENNDIQNIDVSLGVDNRPITLSDVDRTNLHKSVRPDDHVGETMTSDSSTTPNEFDLTVNKLSETVVIGPVFDAPQITDCDWSRGVVRTEDGRQLESSAALLNPPVNFDLSMQSVSSQMGKKEFAGFTKFARKIRPKIVEENPDIQFTEVSRKLAEGWRKLPDEDKKEYEEIARLADVRREKHRNDRPKEMIGQKKEAKTKPKQNEPNLMSFINKMKAREKPKKHEESLSVTSDEIKSKFILRDVMRDGNNMKSVRIVGQLQPSGNWLYVRGSELGHVRHHGLQEFVLLHKMLSSFTVPTRQLENVMFLDKNNFVDKSHLWNVLFRLERVDEDDGWSLVTSHVVSKNGFKIYLNSKSEMVKITELASTIPGYGLLQLLETLQLYVSNGEFAGLAKWRCTSVVNYIKSEAVRISQSNSQLTTRESLQDLVNTWNMGLSHLSPICPHSKPFFVLIHKL